MALSKGTILGTYEIVDSLGAGGMGEVYRANDSKLGRKVTIKVLPDVGVNATGAVLSFSDPIELFDFGDTPSGHTGPYFNFAVSADGQRFLVPRQLVSEDADFTSVTVIVNWNASLKH